MILHLVIRLLAILLLTLSIGWHSSQQQIDAPPGCQMVFAATTRGGGAAAGNVAAIGHIGSGRTTGEVEVVRIINGDTIEIAGGERVRYIGIDAPELRTEPYAIEATRFNASLVEGKKVLHKRMFPTGTGSTHFCDTHMSMVYWSTPS